MPIWEIAAFTHCGRVRTSNQDGVAIDDRLLVGDMATPTNVTVKKDSCILVVADGMGGHVHGTKASRAVLDCLIAKRGQAMQPATCITAIHETCDHLHKLMEADPTTLGMGATVAGVLLSPAQLLVFNVGDAKVFLHSHHHLIQLSRDDVPPTGLSQSGHRISHVVTQAIGGSAFPVPIDPHVSVEPALRRNETLLLCSDGLTDMVAHHQIQDTLSRTANVELGARSLAAQAFRAGAADNLSIVLARCGSPDHVRSHN